MVPNETFFTGPDFEERDSLDPYTLNYQSFANMISLNSPNSGTTYVKRPSMHVCYLGLYSLYVWYLGLEIVSKRYL